MRLTKFSHACVRLASDDGVVVIDPGSFSEEEALADADAVLITHEHGDHLDAEKLGRALTARPDLVIHAHPEVAATLERFGDAVRPVRPGDELVVAGLEVRVCGGRHAVIHADIPQIANVGYLVNGTVYHPGDSVVADDLPPDARVQTLLLPVNAPWLKLAESVDYARAVAPRQAYALHDYLLSEAGATVYGTNLAKLAGCPYERLAPGTAVNA